MNPDGSRGKPLLRRARASTSSTSWWILRYFSGPLYAFFSDFHQGHIIQTNHTGSFFHNYASCWLFSANIKQMNRSISTHDFAQIAQPLRDPFVLPQSRELLVCLHRAANSYLGDKMQRYSLVSQFSFLQSFLHVQVLLILLRDQYIVSLLDHVVSPNQTEEPWWD